MNRVLALPALFFCLFTYTPSYTTFNLIFFYMTWTTLILSHSPFKVELFGSIGVRLLFYILPSALLFLFDALVPSAAVLLKAHGEQGLPTGSKRRGVRGRELKVVGWSFLNIFISIAVQATIETLRIGYFNTRSALKVSFSIPIIPWNIAFHLACVLLLREVSSVSECLHSQCWRSAATTSTNHARATPRSSHTPSTASSSITTNTASRATSPPSTKPGTTRFTRPTLPQPITTTLFPTSSVMPSPHYSPPSSSAST